MVLEGKEALKCAVKLDEKDFFDSNKMEKINNLRMLKI